MHISEFLLSSSATLRHISYCVFISLALLVTHTAHKQAVYTVSRYLAFTAHTCSSVCEQLTEFATTAFQQPV